MITQIEVEGIGICRPLNEWQLSRMLRIANRANRSIASVAFGFGMTVTQFKSLPPEKQREAREASLRLCAPDNCGSYSAYHPGASRPGCHPSPPVRLALRRADRIVGHLQDSDRPLRQVS